MKRNWLEWLILVASVIAILALVGYLLLEATRDGEPASIRVEPRVGEARTSDAGWVLPATVYNDGGEPADTLVVEATATVDGAEEMSAVTLALVPAHSEAEVTFGFSAPPEGEVSVRVVGWQTP